MKILVTNCAMCPLFVRSEDVFCCKHPSVMDNDTWIKYDKNLKNQVYKKCPLKSRDITIGLSIK
jgi:hypothetical protein